jgi:hypothetical protein
MKTVHFPPPMGLRPRPACDYDLLCLRFYRASVARNAAVAMVLARELAQRFGDDVADDAYGHGQMLASCELRDARVRCIAEHATAGIDATVEVENFDTLTAAELADEVVYLADFQG